MPTIVDELLDYGLTEDEAVDFLVDNAEGGWKTIRGAKVFIGKGGKIEKGPKNLVGKGVSELSSKSKKETPKKEATERWEDGGEERTHEDVGAVKFDQLPDHVREMMNGYFFNYEKVNHFARTGEFLPRSKKDKIQNTVQSMKKAFEENAFSTEKGIVVWRGVGAFGDVLKEGDVIKDSGFTSTTFRKVTAGVYSTGGAVMEITVPPGTKYLPGQDHQGEMILAPGYSYRITGVREVKDIFGGKVYEKGNRKIISVEVVHDESV